MRDNLWLEEQMFTLWEEFFNDVPRSNYVLIEFGKKAKRQLGAISWLKDPLKRQIKRLKIANLPAHDDRRITMIKITSLFKDEYIPEYVVKGTIMHEMCHYAHGFSSPLQQVYNHPHKGGVITKELKKRGLYAEYRRGKKWIKENWVGYLRTAHFRKAL
jgi:hypothetical protein